MIMQSSDKYVHCKEIRKKCDKKKQTTSDEGIVTRYASIVPEMKAVVPGNPWTHANTPHTCARTEHSRDPALEPTLPSRPSAAEKRVKNKKRVTPRYFLHFYTTNLYPHLLLHCLPEKMTVSNL